MATANDLTRLVPGFDFLQNLMKGAGLPAMGQWIAPTVDPDELDKRIQELKTVQYWLDNNAKLLGTTIQALEVQRMTLSTLQTMKVPLAELRDALKIETPAPTSPAVEAKAPRPKRAAATAKAAPGTARPAVDPMQWWGAVTQQFSELAAQAIKDTVKDGATGAARNLAGAAVKQAAATAGGTLLKAATLPAQAATQVVSQAARAARKRGRSAR